jgi:hypothetical protein
MIAYKKVKEITTQEEFEHIMKTGKNEKIVVEDEQGRFCMMFIPQSSRFENSYSVVSTWDIRKGNRVQFIPLRKLYPQKLTEFHFEKESAKFALLFSKHIKEELKAKVFLIEGFTAVEYK